MLPLHKAFVIGIISAIFSSANLLGCQTPNSEISPVLTQTPENKSSPNPKSSEGVVHPSSFVYSVKPDNPCIGSEVTISGRSTKSAGKQLVIRLGNGYKNNSEFPSRPIFRDEKNEAIDIYRKTLDDDGNFELKFRYEETISAQNPTDTLKIDTSVPTVYSITESDGVQVFGFIPQCLNNTTGLSP